MKNFLLCSILATSLSCSINAFACDSENDSKDVLVQYKGKQYLVKSQEASYPDMLREMNGTFTAKNELDDLFSGFREQLNQNSKKITLGNLEKTLKEKINICEKVFPIYVQIRKFDRPKRIEGTLEGAVTIPKLTTVDTIRQVTNSETPANQQIISKTTFVLKPEDLKKLAKIKKEKEKSSNQWGYIDELSEELGNLSFTFQCNTTFVEGGEQDPVQTLSLIDANVSTKDSGDILAEQEEKMLVGPNAVAFTVATVKRVYGLFVYAPKGEHFPLKQWGTNANKAATQFWEKAL